MDLNDTSLDAIRDFMPDVFDAQDAQDDADAATAYELVTGREARP